MEFLQLDNKPKKSNSNYVTNYVSFIETNKKKIVNWTK